jgi:hypothetical protein
MKNALTFLDGGSRKPEERLARRDASHARPAISDGGVASGPLASVASAISYVVHSCPDKFVEKPRDSGHRPDATAVSTRLCLARVPPRFPKPIQGYSSLPKPIQAFFGKKDCLFFMRKHWWSALARPHPGPLLPERVNGGPAGLQRRHSISVHSRPGRVPSHLHLPPFRQPIPTFANHCQPMPHPGGLYLMNGFLCNIHAGNLEKMMLICVCVRLAK